MDTKNYTLASAFEEVADSLSESGLSQADFDEVGAATDFLNAKLRISPMQALILAMLFRRAGKSMAITDFAEEADVPPVRLLGAKREFDALVRRGMLYCLKTAANDDWNRSYTLPLGMVNAVMYNRCFRRSSQIHLSPLDVMDHIEVLLSLCDSDKIRYCELTDRVCNLLESTNHLDFCKKLLALNLCHEDLILFLIVATCHVIKDEHLAMKYDYEDIVPSAYCNNLVESFKSGKTPLVDLKLLEATDNDYDTFRLTGHALSDILADFHLALPSRPDRHDDRADKEVNEGNEDGKTKATDKPTRIKRMFYNKEENERIERLRQLLDPEKFESIQSRMRAAGMRPGFICLFYGAPGTGKTETVNQLAEATGREIVMVNVANLRNMYVGESEKNLQEVFDRYREKLEESDRAPILLFNEADAIFGNRYTGINDSVNQLENTLQNILLQNLENFEGILIATTNLTENFDSAFERRFLYKIEFCKPGAEARHQIWHSLLPDLDVRTAASLALQYEFTGGQIENVAKRFIIDQMLFNRPMTIEGIKPLCDEERIKKPAALKRASA